MLVAVCRQLFTEINFITVELIKPQKVAHFL